MLEIHLEDAVLVSIVTLDVFLLYVSEEPWWTFVTDRRTQQEERISVLSLLICDLYWPICMELWRDQVESFLSVSKA